MVNETEAFQSFCRQYFNRLVTAHFADIPNNDPATLSLGNAREAVKRMCLHQDKDSFALTNSRINLFLMEAKGLFDEYIYAMPLDQFESTHTYFPHVTLWFREEKYEASNNNRLPVKSQLSFKYRSEDTSKGNLTSFAQTIAGIFTDPPFSYRKGDQYYTYVDKRLGYYFNTYTQAENDATNLIESTMSIQGDTPPDFQNKLRLHSDNVDYSIRNTIDAAGETKLTVRRRPSATVKFITAEMFINGLPMPITLVDRTGHHPKALVMTR